MNVEKLRAQRQKVQVKKKNCAIACESGNVEVQWKKNKIIC
jgi:dihydroneopterin aldolase